MNFIKRLKVSNFYSIKNCVEMELSASEYSINSNQDRLIKFKNNYYNKVISIYGSNASGKTTLLKALTFIANIITNESSENFPKSFKNKFSENNKATELEIEFVIYINNIPYDLLYKLTLISNDFENIGIYDENLIKLNNKRNTILFSRKNKKIKNVDSIISEKIFDILNQKKSLFEEFFKFETNGVLKNIKTFFRGIRGGSNIAVYNTFLTPTSSDELTIAQILEKAPENKSNFIANMFNNFIINFLKSIGLDIKEIKIIYSDKDIKSIKGIELLHDIDDIQYLDFKLESDGTQMLMRILLDIFMIKITESVLILDEFDSIIHPMLIPVLINLLINENIQIIYSTHNIYNMKFLQNDEVILIEKNNEHNTQLKHVKNIPEIKGFENLLTQYENGVLGGIPNIKNLITKIF